ncbi:MAG: phosphotransferase [Gaiellaceae bacterium]
MDAEAIAQRIWPAEAPRIEVLGGGLTNHNFKVTLETGDAYVIRVAGHATELLGIDRALEHEASLVAAAAGVGPEVVGLVDGCLVTRFIEGDVVPVERMRTPECLKRVAAALRAVHASPAIGGEFDSFRVVEAYGETAIAHGGRVPARFQEAAAIAGRIERARAGSPKRLCHNDLLNANFIDDGVSVRIVDWEYAGMGDVFFDLANFAVNHELDDAQSRLLLEAYFDEPQETDERALVLMRFMSDFREAMWGVVQAAVSQLDVDFEAYAAEHFDRMEHTASSAAFRAALAG